MVRIPVTRPLVSAMLVTGFGTGLLVGADPGTPGASAPQPTAPIMQGGVRDTGSAAVWGRTLRDLAAGRRDQVVGYDSGHEAPVLVAELEGVVPTAVPPIDPAMVALLSRGRVTGGRVAATSVPPILWDAYGSAAASVPSSCRLPVQLLAAIGQVESGSLAGRGLDSRHRAVPAVLGPVLDGGSFAAIRDTDDGRYDGDSTWDRAVGPMQFIPSTWQTWGRDGNGDGVSDPQNVEDSAHSAAAYLCAGGRDLGTAAGLRAAILSYNHSAAYLADVLRLMASVSPGGALPRTGATRPPTTPPPAVPPAQGTPTRQPVRAVGPAALPSLWPTSPTAATPSRPRPPTISTTTTSTLSAPPTTTLTTTAVPSPSSPTPSSPTPSTGPSASTSPGTAACTVETTTATPNSTATLTASTPTATVPPTGSAPPSTGTESASGAAATPPETSTTIDQPVDPCGSSPGDEPPAAGLVSFPSSPRWPEDGAPSPTTLVLGLALAGLGFVLARGSRPVPLLVSTRVVARH